MSLQGTASASRQPAPTFSWASALGFGILLQGPPGGQTGQLSRLTAGCGLLALGGRLAIGYCAIAALLGVC